MVSSRFTTECLGEATSRPINWLWPRYLPRGKLVILDGDPGTGKSLIALDIAARLSRGGPLPDGSESGEPCQVLILSAEDGVEDTIRPRAESAGADLRRVGRIIESGAPIQLPADMIEPRLAADINEPQLAAESTDAALEALPIASTDVTEPMDPIDRKLPTDPMLSTEPRLAMDRTESSEAIDHLDVRS